MPRGEATLRPWGRNTRLHPGMCDEEPSPKCFVVTSFTGVDAAGQIDAQRYRQVLSEPGFHLLHQSLQAVPGLNRCPVAVLRFIQFFDIKIKVVEWKHSISPLNKSNFTELHIRH